MLSINETEQAIKQVDEDKKYKLLHFKRLNSAPRKV